MLYYSSRLAISLITFMLPLGISISASVQVGTMLGAGNHKQAKFSTFVAFLFSMTVSLSGICALLVSRYFLPQLFSDDENVIQLAKDVLPIVAIYQFPDSIQTCANGILRGCGKPWIGAVC